MRKQRMLGVGSSWLVNIPKTYKGWLEGIKVGQGVGGGPIPEEEGCKKCNKCHACPKIEETRTFRSTNTKKNIQNQAGSELC